MYQDLQFNHKKRRLERVFVNHTFSDDLAFWNEGISIYSYKLPQYGKMHPSYPCILQAFVPENIREPTLVRVYQDLSAVI